MAEMEMPVIITAIANPEEEGFIAGTLFSQGWNVIYRALDALSLEAFLAKADADLKNVLLIYSPDLPGIDPEKIIQHQERLRQVIGFSSNSIIELQFPGLFPMPQDPIELLSLLRGFLRAPLLHSISAVSKKQRRARVIALASTAGATGCTTVSINLAMELSLKGHEVLLLDGDLQRPSIAALLDLRQLASEEKWKLIAPKFSASELTREKVTALSEYMEMAMDNFDVIVVDLGSIVNMGDALTDRRWISSVIHWSCDSADSLWFLGKADGLGIHRMGVLAHDFSETVIRAKVSIVLNMKSKGRKGLDGEELFLLAAAPLKPEQIFILPSDGRSLLKAEGKHATLVESDDRSMLRKAILKMAVEVMR